MTQETPTNNPLAAFTPFIGGKWHLDGTYQTLEWDVDQFRQLPMAIACANARRTATGDGRHLHAQRAIPMIEHKNGEISTTCTRRNSNVRCK